MNVLYKRIGNLIRLYIFYEAFIHLCDKLFQQNQLTQFVLVISPSWLVNDLNYGIRNPHHIFQLAFIYFLPSQHVVKNALAYQFNL